MDINDSVKDKSAETVPHELLLEDKFEVDVKELIVNINKNEEEESFLLSSDDKIKDVNLIVRDSHNDKREVDLDIDGKTEEVNKINIIDLFPKAGEHEEIKKEVNKETNTETITVSVHDKVEEVNVLLSNNENEIKEIHLELRNEGENVNEIQLELTDVEKVGVTNSETVTFAEDEGEKIIESVGRETEIKVIDNKHKNNSAKVNSVQENGELFHKEEGVEKTNLTNLEILKNIEEGKGIKNNNLTHGDTIVDSSGKTVQNISYNGNKDTKDVTNIDQNKLNDLSLQSAKSLESKVVWETVSETQKNVDVVDMVKDERKQETDLDDYDDDYFDRHNDVFFDDYRKESSSLYGDTWEEYKNKLLSPTDNTDEWNNGREKSVFLSFLEDRQKEKALSISDLSGGVGVGVKDAMPAATGCYATAQALPVPPPPPLLTGKQHTCGSLFSHCVSSNHSDSLVQTFSKQRNQHVANPAAKPFVDDGYTGPVSLTEIIQEREQNARFHTHSSIYNKKKYSPSNTTAENYCNKTWSDWGVIGAGKQHVAKKPENVRMCKFEEIDEDKQLLMGNGASTPGQNKGRSVANNGHCCNQQSGGSASSRVAEPPTTTYANNHLEYASDGVVPMLKRELKEWELKATDLNSEVIVLRREVKRKEQEIFRLQREVHKLKSVLQQATSFSQDGSQDLLSSLQEKHGMAGQVTGTNNKKQGVSAESSQPNKTATDIQIKKYDKDFRSKQLIKDAIMDNDFLKNLDLSQVREIVESMYPKECARGSYLIREGEAGAHLYVSAEGEFEVIKDNKVLGRMGPGKAFGELAILYNCTRTASIRVINDSKVWVLDRRIFQRIMMRTGLQRLEDNVNFLRSVPLLRNLSVDILAKIADALQVEFYPTGHHIIRQGANGDSFFILSQGSVKITQRLSGSNEEQELRILERGDYFGEQALLKEECRTASVIALPPGVECLTLDRESFIQLIGDLSELQEKEYSDLPRPPSVASVHEQSTGDQELDNIQLNDLDVIATLGIGGFGRVELVQCLHDRSRTFALKCMKKQHVVETHQQEHVYSEKEIMMSCRHPFICRLYKTFKDSKYVYMLLEACLGGEVWTILRDRGCFDDATACFMTACVVEALDYLHSRGIVFRDLKPENLLLDAQGYVKLVDFGFAKRLGFHSSKTWTFCGTPEYVAPEIILNKGHDRAVDIWALGILMHELLTGAPPFSGTDMKVYNMILKGIDMIDFPRHVTKTAQALIKRLCRESPSERLGCQKGGLADIKKHKWFQGFDWEGLRQRTLAPPIIPQLRGCTDISNFDQYSKDNNIPPDENSNWDADF